MNEQRGGHYRFLLSVSPYVRQSNVDATPDLDGPSLSTAMSEAQPVVASIVRSGRLLASRTLRIRPGRVRLTARREASVLSFTVNGRQALTFDDAFPLPTTSGSGPALLWPTGVAVASYQVRTQSLESPTPSPLEQADRLFATGDYLRASGLYADLTTPEARYKLAVCLDRLNDPRAAEIFDRVVRSAPGVRREGDFGNRWRLLATLEAIRKFHGQDIVKFQAAMDTLTTQYSDRLDYIMRVAPTPLWRELERFLQKDGARWRIGLRTRGDIGELKLAIALQEDTAAPPVRLRATRWRLADAYRIAGDLAEARRILEQLAAEARPQRTESREYAAIISDLCWLDFVENRSDLAAARIAADLDGFPDAGEPIPATLALLLIDEARAAAIRGQLGPAAQSIERYFASASLASHGEYVEACLVGGLVQSRLGDAEKAREIWSRGLRRRWRGSLDELSGRGSVWGLNLVDAQKSVEGEALLEPLVGEISPAELLRGARLDLEESGIASQLIPAQAGIFFVGPIARFVVDNLFTHDGGSDELDAMILHQMPLKQHFRTPLIGILFQAVRFKVFHQEELSENFLHDGRDVCDDSSPTMTTNA